jgi:hypothetical protein
VAKLSLRRFQWFAHIALQRRVRSTEIMPTETSDFCPKKSPESSIASQEILMAQSNFTLYIKLANGSSRYCKSALYSNEKIKPNRCIVVARSCVCE